MSKFHILSNSSAPWIFFFAYREVCNNRGENIYWPDITVNVTGTYDDLDRDV